MKTPPPIEWMYEAENGHKYILRSHIDFDAWDIAKAVGYWWMKTDLSLEESTNITHRLFELRRIVNEARKVWDNEDRTLGSRFTESDVTERDGDQAEAD